MPFDNFTTKGFDYAGDQCVAHKECTPTVCGSLGMVVGKHVKSL